MLSVNDDHSNDNVAKSKDAAAVFKCGLIQRAKHRNFSISMHLCIIIWMLMLMLILIWWQYFWRCLCRCCHCCSVAPKCWLTDPCCQLSQQHTSSSPRSAVSTHSALLFSAICAICALKCEVKCTWQSACAVCLAECLCRVLGRVQRNVDDQ